MKLAPVTFKQANSFIADNHRHCGPRHAWKFGVGLRVEGILVGVAMAARPSARELDDGTSIEIVRVCALDQKNANSKLYGAICRASKALGYTVAWSYTLSGESGSSLRAAGFRIDGETTGGRDWHTSSWKLRHLRKPSNGKYPTEAKLRWRKDL